MKRLSFAIICLLGTGAGLAQDGGRRAALESIVQAERDFARAAAEHGVRQAFLMNLADDSTLFRPHAVDGKQWTEASPARPGLLSWFPLYADVSRGGDLGYTTGPYEFRRSAGDKEAQHGYYMTIWKRQPARPWKAVLDQGVTNPRPPAEQGAVLQFGAPGRGPASPGAGLQESLMSVDRDFAAASRKQGTAAAYQIYTAADLRLYREGKLPFVGREAARSVVAEEDTLRWQPAKADSSLAGDLGYTYGSAELGAPGAEKIATFNYVRIWKRQVDGEWRVVLEVLSPCPPPGK